MISYNYVNQGAVNGTSVLNAIQRVASTANFDRLTGLYAYATTGGVKLLSDVLSEAMHKWRWTSKRWLVSLDFGLTEPEALEILVSLSRSEVRILYYSEIMKRQLKPKTSFHLKTLILDTKVGLERGPAGIIVGSANLTFNGLSIGHENAMTINWEKRLSNHAKQQLSVFLNEVEQTNALFNLATPVTKAMIREYTRIRPKRPLKTEDDSSQIKKLMEDSPEISLSKAAIFSTALNFWIDVEYVVRNLGPGMPGNQIDLHRGTRVFFGSGVGQVPRNTSLGNVRLVYGGNISDCHMRFGNNFMDKLTLPVPGVQGPIYENKTLLFQRQPNGSFILKIGTAKDIRVWKRNSYTQGTLYTMKSGREYGVFN